MDTETIQFFECGGCVRDELLGLPVHDVDFTVLAPSFEAMRDHLVAEGFTIFVENPEFVTIRAKVPAGHVLRERTRDADFVLARKDSATSDGRRPDFVEAGTLADDLARRDFTVNALARAVDGTIVDPHGGQRDLAHGVLRFVGNPADRIAEDGLRVMRALRFMVTKGFTMSATTHVAIMSPLAAEMLHKVSTERIREELNKMFRADTLASLALLSNRFTVTDEVRAAIFRDGLRLEATLKA